MSDTPYIGRPLFLPISFIRSFCSAFRHRPAVVPPPLRKPPCSPPIFSRCEPGVACEMWAPPGGNRSRIREPNLIYRFASTVGKGEGGSETVSLGVHAFPIRLYALVFSVVSRTHQWYRTKVSPLLSRNS